MEETEGPLASEEHCASGFFRRGDGRGEGEGEGSDDP